MFQIAYMKKALASQSGVVQEADMAGGSSSVSNDMGREAMSIPMDQKKKQQKGKELRGSRKFWKS